MARCPASPARSIRVGAVPRGRVSRSWICHARRILPRTLLASGRRLAPAAGSTTRRSGESAPRCGVVFAKMGAGADVGRPPPRRPPAPPPPAEDSAGGGRCDAPRRGRALACCPGSAWASRGGRRRANAREQPRPLRPLSHRRCRARGAIPCSLPIAVAEPERTRPSALAPAGRAGRRDPRQRVDRAPELAPTCRGRDLPLADSSPRATRSEGGGAAASRCSLWPLVPAVVRSGATATPRRRCSRAASLTQRSR